jgi:hypothetical protein
MAVEVEVTFNDVSSDSEKWATSAEELRSLAASMEGRDLPNDAFMMAGIEFAGVYRAFLRQLNAHLSDGAGQSSEIAGSLTSAVTSYNSAEDLILARLREITAELEG